MILRIVLFLFYVILVSSNNEFSVIPAQTYPNYQQNVYTNPTPGEPNDISSYLQGVMAQNQSPSLNLSPSNIKQILLNRILSKQPMQTVFDPNLSGYGSNPNNPVAIHPVGNYLAAPMNGYLNNQENGDNFDKNIKNKTGERRKKSKKRKSSISKKRQKSENITNNVSKYDAQENNRETRKNSKKSSRKPKTDGSHDTNSEDKNHKKKKKRKNKENKVIDSVKKESTDENSKPRRRQKKKPKSDQDNKENVVYEQQTTPKPKQIQDNFNLAHFTEGIVEENRIARNPIPEANDLFKSIPSFPENIANGFNFKSFPQMNDNPSMSSFLADYQNLYQSMLSKNKGLTDKTGVTKRKPKKNRANNNIRKTDIKNKNSTTTESSVVSKQTVSPKVSVVTTEKTIYIKEKTRTNIEPISKNEDTKSIDKPSEVKETTTAKFETETFEDIKDLEPNRNDDEDFSKYNHFGDGYIADYYPLFTDNAAYTANNREVYVKNLGDTKYYYAVDKTNPELSKRMRFEGFGLPQRDVKEYKKIKTYNDTEKESIDNAIKSNLKETKEEVIQFRTPPQLESPDFQTRKIEKSEINPELNYDFDGNNFDDRFVGDKASIFSEAKIPHYTGGKENTSKDKSKDIETVFARSKVATYSPVYYPELDSTSVGPSNQVLTDNNEIKDGGTTYILATSLDYPETFW